MKKLNYEACPIRIGMRVVGGKWALIILVHLARRTKRYGELKRGIQDISEKMLIQNLRVLEENGMISRKDYFKVPPKVEYTLTERGKKALEMVPVLFALFGGPNDMTVERLLGREERSVVARVG